MTVGEETYKASWDPPQAPSLEQAGAFPFWADVPQAQGPGEVDRPGPWSARAQPALPRQPRHKQRQQD